MWLNRTGGILVMMIIGLEGVFSLSRPEVAESGMNGQIFYMGKESPPVAALDHAARFEPQAAGVDIDSGSKSLAGFHRPGTGIECIRNWRRIPPGQAFFCIAATAGSFER